MNQRLYFLLLSMLLGILFPLVAEGQAVPSEPSVGLQDAPKVSCKFADVSLSEALRKLNQLQNSYSISFINNELETYRVSTRIRNRSVPDAVRQVIGFYPVRCVVEGRHIFVEPRIKTNLFLTGRVLNERHRGVPFATVALLSSADSSIVTTGVSNEEGRFTLPTTAARALVRVSHVGYLPRFAELNAGQSDDIQLRSAVYPLPRVAVEQSRVEYLPTGFRFNLRNFQPAKGRNARDVLVYLPGVTIENGHLCVGGKPVGEVYINGLPITNQAELQAIPADQLEQVVVEELSDGTLFATGTSVLRIQMQRPRASHYFGNAEGKLGLYTHHGYSEQRISSINSYAWKRWNLYNYFQLGRERFIDDREETLTNMPTADGGGQTNANPGSPITTFYNYREGADRQDTRQLTDRLTLSGELCAGHKIAASVQYARSLIESSTDQIYNTDPPTADLLRKQEATSQLNSLLRYDGRLSERGDGIHAQAEQFYFYQRKGEQFAGTDRQLWLDNHARMYALRLAYHLPLSPNTLLRTGANLSYTNQEQLADMIFKPQNGPKTSSYTSIHVLSPELYSLLEGSFARFQFNAGVYLQQHRVGLKAWQTAYRERHRQQSASPRMQLRYFLDANRRSMLGLKVFHQLQNVPYDGITKQTYWITNDQFSFGNNQLKAPSATHVEMEISLANQRLRLFGLYRQQHHAITFATNYAQPFATYFTQPVNISKPLTDLGIGIEALLRPTSWWQTKFLGRFTCSRSADELALNDQNRWQGRTYWTMQHSFAISPTCHLSLDGTLVPTFRRLNVEHRAIYRLQGSISKQLKRSLSLRLDVVPFDRYSTFTIHSEAFRRISASHHTAHSVLFTLRYSLGSAKHSQPETAPTLEYQSVETPPSE